MSAAKSSSLDELLEMSRPLIGFLTPHRHYRCRFYDSLKSWSWDYALFRFAIGTVATKIVNFAERLLFF